MSLWSSGTPPYCAFQSIIQRHRRHFTSVASVALTALLAKKPKQRISLSATVPADQKTLNGKSDHLCFTPDTILRCLFHSEFNYVKDDEGKCVPVPGTTPRPDDDSCCGNEEYWYERTAYRKVTHSSCEGGDRIDRGTPHRCPGIRGHSTLFWIMVALFPFVITALVAWWWYKKSGLARG